MPGPITEYSEEKAVIVIEALRSGRRPGSAAQLIGTTRQTLYNWRDEHEDFAARWNEAVSFAGDRVEETVYRLAVNGDLGACAYWLKHMRPERFDRATWMKLAVIQSSLKAAQANGSQQLVLDIDADGMPVLPAPGVDPLRTGENLQPIFVLTLPDNGRDEVLAPPIDDGSGRTWPLPKSAMAIMQGEQCVKLTADEAEVPGGAIPTLWKRIQAFNELASMSKPANRNGRGRVEAADPGKGRRRGRGIVNQIDGSCILISGSSPRQTNIVRGYFWCKSHLSLNERTSRRRVV
jgi:transposase-like protein